MGNAEGQLDCRNSALHAGVNDFFRLIGTLGSDNGDNAAVLNSHKNIFFIHNGLR